MINRVRDRRLESDFMAAQAVVLASRQRIMIEESFGSPPESYHFLFRCRSVSKIVSDVAFYREEHRVAIQFPSGYPAQPPFAAMLTPVIHPHIWPNGTLCLGSWKPGEKLDSLLQRIGAILTYDPIALNWRSVADDAAAIWAKQNLDLFPLDRPFFSAVPFRMLNAR